LAPWWINPFKPEIILASNMTSGKEVEVKKPMSWSDAAKLAAVVTLTQIFVGFFTLYTFEDIALNPLAFLYKLLVFAGGTFFVTFGTLTGISHYYASK